VTSIIFLAPISAYNEALVEEPAVNRLVCVILFGHGADAELSCLGGTLTTFGVKYVTTDYLRMSHSSCYSTNATYSRQSLTLVSSSPITSARTLIPAQTITKASVHVSEMAKIL
jgi:hypothetical protein